jgi:hypothetical protein
MGLAGYVSVCVQLYCVGFHCFTTCFALHGHLQVCRIFASKETHTGKETTKTTKENRRKNTIGNMQRVTT